MANLRSLQAIHTEKRLEEKIPQGFGGNAHWRQPLEWTVSECLKNCEVRLSLNLTFPHLSLYPENTTD